MADELSRRKLLWIGGGALCAQALGCGSALGGDVPTTVPAGKTTDVGLGSLKVIPGAPVAIGRDAKGIYALVLYCTHAGCDMSVDGSVSASGIDCFCHDSVFDAQGNPLRGPARGQLPHLAVTADAAGQLTVHGDQQVAASARLTV